MKDKRQQVVESLQDWEYRHLYAAEHNRTGIAVQIRAMREERGWTQAELGERAGGIAQERISQLEDLDYGRFSLKTLERLALPFDVALFVRFVPFSSLVDWVTSLSPADLAVPSFDDDRLLQAPSSDEFPSSEVIVGAAVEDSQMTNHAHANNVVNFEAWKQKRYTSLYGPEQATTPIAATARTAWRLGT